MRQCYKLSERREGRDVHLWGCWGQLLQARQARQCWGREGRDVRLWGREFGLGFKGLGWAAVLYVVRTVCSSRAVPLVSI